MRIAVGMKCCVGVNMVGLIFTGFVGVMQIVSDKISNFAVGFPPSSRARVKQIKN